ncbi:TlpA family protein disulfide reductase [Thiorhodococcus mannitoliphagus]|uniref:TlpA family protein disulfide reductase n=1 Tax=Thiorhodococcus mannitoliphagus TaxID=329406 RepID=A0A6P1DQK1_9GAMM|nr:TlpA disulfide reductase family protein [Thiorhodococcus mannitoliphagus]NEX18946.1 TlpA family protein disulfide reductase [Thiorhodococcus mannitoliphagus]
MQACLYARSAGPGKASSLALKRRSRGRIVLVAAGLSLCMSAAEAAGVLSPAPAATAAPELVLPDLDDELMDLTTLKGKVVLVSFWASWCRPCLEEIPSLQQLAAALQDMPFAIVGVNLAEAPLRVKTLVRRLGIRFPVVLDRDSASFDRWGATLIPTTFVLDRQGFVRFVGRGLVDWDSAEIMDLLQALIREGTATLP